MSEVIGSFCSFLPRGDCVGCPNLSPDIEIPVPVTLVNLRSLQCCELRAFIASIKRELPNKEVYCCYWNCQRKGFRTGRDRIGLCFVDGSMHGTCRLCGEALY